MAGLSETCSHVAAHLFYLDSLARASSITCTQLNCTWNIPSTVAAIPYARVSDLPFTIPKPKVHCNKKKGAHLYVDTLPDNELPVGEYHLERCHSLAEHPSPPVILSLPPTEDEQFSYRGLIAKHKPVSNSINSPFSDCFAPDASVPHLPPSLNSL